MSLSRRVIPLAVVMLLLAVVTSCDDSSSSGGTTGGFFPAVPPPDRTAPGGSTAFLTVRLHDAPAPEIAQAWVTFGGVSAHLAGGDWVPVPGDYPVTVDLLTLVNGRSIDLSAAAMPPGRYDAIRLDISSAYVVCADETRIDVPVPAQGISVTHAVSFTCQEGQPVTVTLDFQAQSSFRLVGSGVVFSPTVATDAVIASR